MTTLTIQDLAKTEELDSRAMSAVRGGLGNQANGTDQSNIMAAFAPVRVADGSKFIGSGPVNIQSDSSLDQSASNDSTSDNFQGNFAFGFPVIK